MQVNQSTRELAELAARVRGASLDDTLVAALTALLDQQLTGEEMAAAAGEEVCRLNSADLTPRHERIRQIIAVSSAPLSPADVCSELKAQGDVIEETQMVNNALNKLLHRGDVRRVTRGQYENP